MSLPYQPDESLPIVPVGDEAAERLGNLAGIVVEEDRAYVDAGALHGRSAVEKGIQWVGSPEEVPRGRRVWIAWVTLGRIDGQRGYRGLTVSEMWIDEQAGVGYKHLADHVNAMKAALDGKVDLQSLPPSPRKALQAELKARGLAYWNHASPEIRAAFKQG